MVLTRKELKEILTIIEVHNTIDLEDCSKYTQIMYNRLEKRLKQEIGEKQ